MDKQELIKKINELPTYGYDTTIVKRHVLALVEQLDEPKTVMQNAKVINNIKHVERLD